MIRHTQRVHGIGIARFGGKTIPCHLLFVLLSDFSFRSFIGICHIPKLCRLLPKRNIRIHKFQIGKCDDRPHAAAVGGAAKILSGKLFVVKVAGSVKINRRRAHKSVHLPCLDCFVEPCSCPIGIVFFFAKLRHLPKGIDMTHIDGAIQERVHLAPLPAFHKRKSLFVAPVALHRHVAAAFVFAILNASAGGHAFVTAHRFGIIAV